MTTTRIGLDSLPTVTEDEALELCVHHLQLAAIYYMNVNEDLPASLAEARRIILRDCPAFDDDPRWVGAEAFLRASHTQHEAAKLKFKGSGLGGDDDEPAPEPDETVKRYLEP